MCYPTQSNTFTALSSKVLCRCLCTRRQTEPCCGVLKVHAQDSQPRGLSAAQIIFPMGRNPLTALLRKASSHRPLSSCRAGQRCTGICSASQASRTCCCMMPGSTPCAAVLTTRPCWERSTMKRLLINPSRSSPSELHMSPSPAVFGTNAAYCCLQAGCDESLASRPCKMTRLVVFSI